MYSIIDHAGNRYDFTSVVPAMKKYIAEQNRRNQPHLYVDDKRVDFRTSPKAARAAGYSEETIFRQFADIRTE